MDVMLERIQECIGYRHGAKKELADGIGIDQKVITGWLSGRTKSYKSYLPQIAEFYSVSMDWLAGNGGERIPLEQNEKPAAPKGDRPRDMFDKLFAELTAENQMRVVEEMLKLQEGQE